MKLNFYLKKKRIEDAIMEHHWRKHRYVVQRKEKAFTNAGGSLHVINTEKSDVNFGRRFGFIEILYAYMYIPR